ncbi:hypothetical protein WME99_22910 [Sorangium sp. So ce136]|uniref:hypothetical protein n=1 Tax=Sorangium sp. So ce136 TaxID=3133284 RepID=UPI003EFF5783
MLQDIPTIRTDDETIGRAHDLGRTNLQQLLRGQPIESNMGSTTNINEVRHAQ